MAFKMTTKAKWAHMEYMGRTRAQKSTKIFDVGKSPIDSFTHEGMAIHDPWMSSCGRFKVDPYTTYGRPFIIWLIMG